LLRRFWFLQFSQIFKSTENQLSFKITKNEIHKSIRDLFQEDDDLEVVDQVVVKGFTVTTEHWIKVNKCYMKILLILKKDTIVLG